MTMKKIIAILILQTISLSQDITIYVNSVDDNGAGQATIGLYIESSVEISGYQYVLGTNEIFNSLIENADYDCGGITESYQFTCSGGSESGLVVAFDMFGEVIPPGQYSLNYFTYNYNISNIGNEVTLIDNPIRWDDIDYTGTNFAGIDVNSNVIEYEVNWIPMTWTVGTDIIVEGEITPATYNVYRDGYMIASGIEENQYLDQDLPNNHEYCYTVTGVINGEESVPSLESCVILGELTNYNIELPKNIAINIYPNPFNPITNIKYLTTEYTNVSIDIYDIYGEKIENLINQYYEAGNYTIEWNAEGYPSGVYFVKLDAGEFTQTQKLMLVK